MGIKMRDGTGAQTGLGGLTHLCLMRASWEPADLFHSPDVTVLTVTFFFFFKCLAPVNFQRKAEDG